MQYIHIKSVEKILKSECGKVFRYVGKYGYTFDTSRVGAFIPESLKFRGRRVVRNKGNGVSPARTQNGRYVSLKKFQICCN
jgi:hypothetical protein